MKYVCKVCANIVEGEPPKICPICKMENYYVSVVGTMFEDAESVAEADDIAVKNISSEDLDAIKQISDNKEFIKAMDDLKATDIIEYQIRMDQIRNQIEQKLNNQNQTNQTPVNETPQPDGILRCPICGSTDVKRISTVSKMVSTEMFGLASSSLGKQYECLKCHHKW